MADIEIGTVFLTEVEDAIGKFNNVTAKELIDLIPLNLLSVDITDKLFISLLKFGQGADNLEMVPIIFEKWQEVYPEEERTPFYSYLFIQSWFLLDLLVYCSKYYQDVTYMEVIMDITELGQFTYTTEACSRADQVYGPQSLDIYKQLCKQSKLNPDVQNFLSNKIRTINIYAPIPKWVKNFVFEDRLPYESEINIPETPPVVFELPSDPEIAQLVTQGVSLERSRKRQEEAWLVKLATLSVADKKELVEPVFRMKQLEALQDDLELFRLLGPVHPQLKATVEELEYGGERMFISQLFDYNEELDEVEPWFQGFCWKCDRRIRRQWHAVRLPMSFGGWKGCFCSWKCAIGMFYTWGDPDIMVSKFIRSFDRQINEIGVQDRLPDPLVEGEEEEG